MLFTSHRYVTGALRLASAPLHASTLGEILQPEFLFKVTHVCRLGTRGPQNGLDGRRVLKYRRTLRDTEARCCLLAMNAYVQLSSDTLSREMTVHSPWPVTFAMTSPFWTSRAQPGLLPTH